MRRPGNAREHEIERMPFVQIERILLAAERDRNLFEEAWYFPVGDRRSPSSISSRFSFFIERDIPSRFRGQFIRATRSIPASGLRPRRALATLPRPHAHDFPSHQILRRTHAFRRCFAPGESRRSHRPGRTERRGEIDALLADPRRASPDEGGRRSRKRRRSDFSRRRTRLLAKRRCWNWRVPFRRSWPRCSGS